MRLQGRLKINSMNMPRVGIAVFKLPDHWKGVQGLSFCAFFPICCWALQSRVKEHPSIRVQKGKSAFLPGPLTRRGDSTRLVHRQESKEKAGKVAKVPGKEK